MSLYYQPILLERGADYSSPIWTVFAPDGVSPKSLANYTAALIFTVNAGDARPQLSMTQANGITISAATGQVSFSVPASKIALFTDRAGTWSLFVYSPDSPPASVRVASGTWTLTGTAPQ